MYETEHELEIFLLLLVVPQRTYDSKADMIVAMGVSNKLNNKHTTVESRRGLCVPVLFHCTYYSKTDMMIHMVSGRDSTAVLKQEAYLLDVMSTCVTSRLII